MTAEVLLDLKGDVPLYEGYISVENDVAFLEYCTKESPLMIRGERLCTWAEVYYTIRRRPFRYVASPASVLLEVFPNLNQQQAQSLADRLGFQVMERGNTSSISILEGIYTDQLGFWGQKPSIQHAARWLLWLSENDPDESIKVVLQSQAEYWYRESLGPEVIAYRALDKTQAKTDIFAWLGLTEQEDWKSLGEFPEVIPPGLEDEIRDIWRSMLLDTQGAYFERSLHWPLPSVIRQQLASETVEYYKQHHRDLNRERLSKLRPYLSQDQIRGLEGFILPETPTPAPEDAREVFEWFVRLYLPYRQWQQHSKDDQANEHIQNLVRDFELWYLRSYPLWLLEKQHLSFFRTGSFVTEKSVVITLVIVMDGLPIWDAQSLVRIISAREKRLVLSNFDFAYAPIPTITEFAKESLLKGVPPRFIEEYSYLGKVLPENMPLSNALSLVQSGDILFWRLQEPDRTYHSRTTAGSPHQINAQLEAFVSQLTEITRLVPENERLRVIITSDHGRLLNNRSSRRIPIPRGMQAHGRAAWGKLDRSFDENGYYEDTEGKLFFIFGERYELVDDLVLPIYEECFMTSDKKGGQEAYPHGGLYPEEVIVPWLVYERDVAEPKIFIEISGSGEAGKTGVVYIKIKNLSDLHLVLMSVHMTNGIQKECEWDLLPFASTEHSIEIQPWPAKPDVKNTKAHLLIRQLDGRTHEQVITPNLAVTEMYSRDQNILEGLNL